MFYSLQYVREKENLWLISKLKTVSIYFRKQMRILRIFKSRSVPVSSSLQSHKKNPMTHKRDTIESLRCCSTIQKHSSATVESNISQGIIIIEPSFLISHRVPPSPHLSTVRRDTIDEYRECFFSDVVSCPLLASNTHSRIVEISRSNFIFFHCYFFSSLAWAARLLLGLLLFARLALCRFCLFASFLIFRKWFLHAKTARWELFKHISLLFLARIAE